MRDPNRIDGVLNELSEIWKAHPDLRLGQLILNLRAPGPNGITWLYNMEDDSLVEGLRDIYG